jgi:uncharacterized protein (TIGR02594 family)
VTNEEYDMICSRIALAVLAALTILILTAPADARRATKAPSAAAPVSDVAAVPAYPMTSATAVAREKRASRGRGRVLTDSNGNPVEITHQRAAQSIDDRADPRPAAWCAWWLRRHLHIARSAFPPYQYNMARAFAKIGTPAPKGCTGCVAVFSRGRGGHVGIVEGWDPGGNPIILSGNFNGRVGTAPHPASRLLALRWVS